MDTSTDGLTRKSGDHAYATFLAFEQKCSPCHRSFSPTNITIRHATKPTQKITAAQALTRDSISWFTTTSNTELIAFCLCAWLFVLIPVPSHVLLSLASQISSRLILSECL